nr:MAG TPA: Cell Wall Hydrolase [Caudoviricetes sp.]
MSKFEKEALLIVGIVWTVILAAAACQDDISSLIHERAKLGNTEKREAPRAAVSQDNISEQPVISGYATEMPCTDELELLALVVEAEAGNQDLTGKRLVVDVVLNRVESPLFPDTITEVLTQPGQFVTLYNGGVDRARQSMQEDDYTAVAMEVTGERLDYNIYYFNNEGYNPSGKPLYQYGDHYFNGQ